jgi:hypothetical protein
MHQLSKFVKFVIPAVCWMERKYKSPGSWHLRETGTPPETGLSPFLIYNTPLHSLLSLSVSVSLPPHPRPVARYTYYYISSLKNVSQMTPVLEYCLCIPLGAPANPNQIFVQGRVITKGRGRQSAMMWNTWTVLYTALALPSFLCCNRKV